MTLGEKIRHARRKCGFSQEQLAEKLAVSRSAIAKWETDKGLPDVGNLKMLARLLRVSVDSLLDEAEMAEESVIREAYRLEDYGYGCKRVKKDRVVRHKFPDSTIYPLLARRIPGQLPEGEEVAPDCRVSVGNRLKDTDRSFYLVEKDGRQLLVKVSDAYVEQQPLEQPLGDGPFSVDGYSFVKCNYYISG